MSKEIKLTLNDALYNAGILGFIRICKFKNLNYEIDDNSLTFGSDILKNFTTYYLDTLINAFQNDIVFYEILSRYYKFKNGTHNISQTELEKDIKYIVEKLGRNSYLAAYEILNKRGDNFNYTDKLKQIKTTKELDDKIVYVNEIMEKIHIHKELFQLKDIAYTKIQPFWTNTAFLLKTANKDEFTDSYEKSFVTPVNKFLEKVSSSQKLQCFQCNTPISASSAGSMAWINDEGIDIKRKTSYYWNFNPDTFLCPVCSIVYSCIPLGFAIQGSDGIFINSNNNVDELITKNVIPIIPNGEKTDIYWRVINQFMHDTEQLNAKFEIDNIKIIRCMNGQYYFNILSKEKLEVLKDCNNSFKNITNVYIQINGESHSLYRTVLTSVLNGYSLFPLIQTILHNQVEAGSTYRYVWNVLQIQTHMYLKGDGKMNDKKNYSIAASGQNLRKIMLGDERNDNKLRSLSFHLLNSLKAQNSTKFIDTLLRQYLSIGLPAPYFMTELHNEDKFLIYGYSFVSGLNGSITEKKEDE